MKIEPEIIGVRITFTEEVLGTSPNNPNIHDEFIASKAPDAVSREEEIAAIGVEEAIEKSMTVFPRMKDDSGNEVPFLWNYQIKGFFKDTCSALRKIKGSESSKIKAFKKEIDGLIFIAERKIPFQNPDGLAVGDCQRSLRAQTAQGERTSLACSETVPAGSFAEFHIEVFKPELCEAVREWLDFGTRRGLCQWRNSGKGTFVWEEI